MVLHLTYGTASLYVASKWSKMVKNGQSVITFATDIGFSSSARVNDRVLMMNSDPPLTQNGQNQNAKTQKRVFAKDLWLRLEMVKAAVYADATRSSRGQY
jgi:hypothetical protein